MFTVQIIRAMSDVRIWRGEKGLSCGKGKRQRFGLIRSGVSSHALRMRHSSCLNYAH